MSRFSSGRDSLEPEMPRSTYSPKTSHPRRDAYSRSSANCISGLCPLHVETLAYRATRMSIPPRVARGQMAVFPKAHTGAFSRISQGQVESLARILRDVLQKLDHTLGGPPYNLSLQDRPFLRAMQKYIGREK